MFEIPVLYVKPEKREPFVDTGEKSPSLLQSITRVLRIVVYPKNNNDCLSWNTNHGILFLYILVIVCANLTSTLIFKRLSKGLQIYVSSNRILQ